MGNARDAGAQVEMLGAVNVLMEVVLYGTIGVLAGVFQARLLGSRTVVAVSNYVAGAVYLVLAGVVAVEVLAG